jgi:hypothetical protein
MDHPHRTPLHQPPDRPPRPRTPRTSGGDPGRVDHTGHR